MQQVDDYLAKVGPPHRDTLVALRATIRRVLPHADECLKYGMPAFELNGKGVAYYAAFKDHCSYFPASGSVLDAAGRAASQYSTSKGGLRFPADKPLSVALVRHLVKLRLAEISAVDNGQRFEYYPDGQVKARGRMKGGQFHGAWKWFRQDGSLMRIGHFSNGVKVGTWETWDRAGTLVKTTRF